MQLAWVGQELRGKLLGFSRAGRVSRDPTTAPAGRVGYNKDTGRPRLYATWF